VLVYVIATVLYYRKMHDFPELAMRKCAQALLPSAIVTVAASIVPAVVAFWPGLLTAHPVSAFAVAVVGGGAGWILGAIVVRHPLLGELGRVVSIFRGYLGGPQKL
jgi:hypothetical protein